MANDNSSYIVVGTRACTNIPSALTEILVLNPANKKRLRVNSAEYVGKILDIYACDSGIYHASEIITPKYKRVDDVMTPFDTNVVQIFDSISLNSCMTIVPKGSEDLPLEKRLIPLEFKFVDNGNSLNYTLNNDSGVVFHNCVNNVKPGNVAFNGIMLYLDGKKITIFNKNIFYAKEVDARKFAQAYKKKDKQRFNKNKDFFCQ